jgi:hypothetical protein
VPRSGKNAGIDVPRASGEQFQIEGSREPLETLDQAKWLYLILEQNRGRRVGALRSVDLVHSRVPSSIVMEADETDDVSSVNHDGRR